MKFVKKYKSIGRYNRYTICRFCFSDKLSKVIHLGYVPLAGGFLRSQKDFSHEKLYPSSLAFCENCFLLQTREVIDANTLFKDYFYHSSAIKTPAKKTQISFRIVLCSLSSFFIILSAIIMNKNKNIEYTA